MVRYSRVVNEKGGGAVSRAAPSAEKAASAPAPKSKTRSEVRSPVQKVMDSPSRLSLGASPAPGWCQCGSGGCCQGCVRAVCSEEPVPIFWLRAMQVTLCGCALAAGCW